MAFRSTITRIRPGIRQDLQRLLKPLVARARTRRAVNALYRRLSFRRCREFSWIYSRIFGAGDDVEPGHWAIDFAGRRVVMPLTRDNLADDWAVALALLGQDSEIKETYARVIGWREPPDLFLDIGANIGMHSLLFAVHDIESWSFEPNPACHDRCRALFRLNGVEPQIIEIAIAQTEGMATLSFEPGSTAIGTIDPGKRQALAENATSRSVPLTTLDRFLPAMEGRRILLKIDTEGAERLVIQGAGRTLATLRPLVIFESLVEDPHRDELFAQFAQLEYELCDLPWPSRRADPSLGVDEFRGSRFENFIAVPAETRAT